MHHLLLIGLVIFSILSVLVRDLLKAAISLAVASIFLAIIFFRLNASYAGVFEVSVVAGLITVLFITAIALTRSDEQVAESKVHKFIFPLFFLALLAVDILVMKSLLGRIPVISSSEAGTFGDIMWKERSFDLIGQIGVIFAGVLAVLALFRPKGKSSQGDMH
ncbi:MAG TPA: NADH-quinone oxidoreductase subunit J, partial [Candidatus Binatia bacterium]|nr:NADH-quinone oxidoreductase subunit J [Candidatus Binatia bacterium]